MPIITCQGRPLPRSYVPNRTANNRIDGFINKKYIPLSKLLPGSKYEAKEIPYNQNQLLRLKEVICNIPGADGIRMYFASYGKNTAQPTPSIPTGYEDLLTIIFAPTSHRDGLRKKDTGHYFIINPTSPECTTAPDYGVKSISFEAADHFVKMYKQNKLPRLLEVGREDDQNFDETLSIWFPLTFLEEWLQEIYCWQMADNGTTNGLLFIFAAYSETELAMSQDEIRHEVPYQLSLIIRLAHITSRGAKIFDIENYEGFHERLNKAIDENLTVQFTRSSTTNFDTGKPCPPPSGGCSGASLS